MNERLLSVLQAQHVSEKSARLQEINQYVFLVARDATRDEVKGAVEELFKVQVASVNMANQKGKTRAFRNRTGVRGGKRKAYVRLVDGHVIDTSAKP